MTGQELAVLGAGLAGIGWVNWYFFLAKGEVATAQAGAGGAQEVTIDRQETSGCSEEVVFPDFGVRKFLPAFEKTTVEFTPQEAGTYGFTCGMSMLQGRLEVE